MQIAGHGVHVATVGDGPQAVMLHCMLARHEGLLPLAKAIGGQVTLIDLPGHGQSDVWDGKTDYSALCVKAAAACCDGPTHLIGHSFGATVALRLAVERPDLVNRLTLIEPVYFAAAKGTPAQAAHQKVFRPFISAMLMGDEDRAAKVFCDLWNPVPWDKTPAEQRAYITNRIHLVVASGAGIEEDADGIVSKERLARLALPVTLIRGDRTQPVIAAIHSVLADRIADVTDHVVAGAGHMLAMDRRQINAVAEIIRAANPETD